MYSLQSGKVNPDAERAEFLMLCPERSVPKKMMGLLASSKKDENPSVAAAAAHFATAGAEEETQTYSSCGHVATTHP